VVLGPPVRPRPRARQGRPGRGGRRVAAGRRARAPAARARAAQIRLRAPARPRRLRLPGARLARLPRAAATDRLVRSGPGALDERIKAADVVCYLSTVRHDAITTRGRGNFCGSQFLRGLLTFGDVSTIAGLIAPRPLLAEIGERDTCFVVDDAQRCYAEVAQ